MRSFVKTSLVSIVAVVLLALAASSAKADPITITTYGTFTSSDPTQLIANTTLPGGNFSKARFGTGGDYIWIRFFGSSQVLPNFGGPFSLGYFQTQIALPGTTTTGSGTFTLTINQTIGSQTLSGSLVANFTVVPSGTGSTAFVTFTTSTLVLGNIHYLVSNNGSLTALNDSAPYGPLAPVNGAATPNPEPATLLLLGTGLMGVAAGLRRKHRGKKATGTS